MADMEASVSLTQSERRFVEDQVASGRHANASDVVHEALRRYADDIQADRARLRALAEEGEADIRAGRFVEARNPAELRRVIEDISREADTIPAGRTRRPR